MKILLIDNGTSYLSQLKNLLSGHMFRVVKYSEINTINSEDFDSIILSGGHSFSVRGNENRLQKEFDLVKNSIKPIFGICFGFEIIAHTLGAKLELMQNKEYGILTIQVVESDKIFLNIPNFKVFENHRWIVKEPVEGMQVLARSKDGIEAFKIRAKPIYAVQFHPKMFIEKSCGDEVFQNFLDSIKRLR